VTVTNERLLEFLEKMILTRRMEERHAEVLARYKQTGETFICFSHFSRGQEAVGIGATAALRPEDVMIGSHRGFVEYLGKGMEPLDIFAEYLGRKRILDGKAGIQVSDKEHNIPGMTACIGGGFGMAVGMAYAMKLRGEDRIVMLCYGDGGYNQSDAHPAMLVASSLKLPVLFHVPYNGWVEYTRSEEFNPTKSVAARGVAYGIEADSVDGQRVDVVYEAACRAVDYVRSGKGPFIMEYRTFRMGPHWSGDDGSYMDGPELARWRERDPIGLCKELLMERGAVTAEGLEQLEEDVDLKVEEVLGEALRLPFPDRDDLYANVFA
jgi:TPP-dependent pyruvate/acetoin dehydrogenase alpha subunit